MTSLSDAAPLDACWNRIGVRGDGSCPELTQHVHCRNCPVYAGAAARLLDVPLPPGRLHEAASHFARPEAALGENALSAFLFRLGGEWLALPTGVFQEAAPRKTIHSLPHRRGGAILGMVSIRGELLVCVALDRVLGLDQSPAPKPEPGRRQVDRFLVVSGEGGRLVFPVDEVHGIARFPSEALREAPATVAKAAAPFARGVLPWRDGTAGYLDPRPLFAALNRSLA